MLAILVVAFAVFAWQQGDDDGGGGPLNAIAAAAEKTQEEPGGRMAIRTIISSSERPAPIAITGQGVYDAEDRSRARLVFRNPDTNRLEEMDVVGDETAIYIRASFLGSLPGGREWMGLDLGQGEGSETPLGADVDASGELELLEAVADGSVVKLGEEDVHGMPTTRYRAAVGRSDGKGSPLRVEVWIDAEGLVRRMRIVGKQQSESGKGTTTNDTRVDFLDLGIEPEIDVPDSSEVFDATGLAKEQIDSADD